MRCINKPQRVFLLIAAMLFSATWSLGQDSGSASSGQSPDKAPASAPENAAGDALRKAAQMQPVNLQLGFHGNAVHPVNASPWSMRVQIVLLFPKKP
jgi:hypothetical protein